MHRRLLALAAAVVVLAGCGGHSIPKADPVAEVNRQLALQGAPGQQPPVTTGTGQGTLSLSIPAGAPLALSVLCQGGASVGLALNGHSIGRDYCQPGLTVGTTLKAIGNVTTVIIAASPGQQWWAGLRPVAVIR